MSEAKLDKTLKNIKPEKEGATENSKVKALEDALSKIRKEYGAGSIMQFGDKPIQDVQAISTSCLSLDAAIGIGGVPRGRVVECYANEGVGKCLGKDVYLQTDRGLETIEELFNRMGRKASCTSGITDVQDKDIHVVNQNGEMEKIHAITHNNKRPLFRLSLESGKFIDVTANHPLKTINKQGYLAWEPLQNLKVGDIIVSAPFGANQDNSASITEDEAELIGLLIADAHLNDKNHVSYTKTFADDAEKFKNLFKKLFNYTNVKVYDNIHFHVNSKAIRDILYSKYGLDYVVAAGKTIPKCVRHAPSNIQIAFLRSYMNGDGHFDKRSRSEVTSASKLLMQQVQLMMFGLGIKSTLSPHYNKEYDRNYWRLYLGAEETKKMVSMTNVLTYSDRRIQQISNAEKTKQTDWTFNITDSIPNLIPMLRTLRQDIGGDNIFSSFFTDLIQKNIDCTRERLAKIIAWAKPKLTKNTVSANSIISYLEQLVSYRFAYEEIVSIESIGVQPTFDIYLPDTHSFIANGIVSHNTTLALHVVAEAQKANGVVAYCDVEHALDANYAQALGIDLSKMFISQPNSAEEALTIVEELIKSNCVDLVVIDSVAALVPQSEIDGDMGQAHMAIQARLMSQALRKLTAMISRTNTCVFFINQTRSLMNVSWGPSTTTSGGKALKFYSSVRLELSKISTIKDGDTIIGNRTKIKVVKNKVAPPMREVELDLIYGHGFSKESDLIDLGVANKIIEKSGAWYSYSGERFQGKDNVKNGLKTNPELYAKLEAEVRKIIGLA